MLSRVSTRWTLRTQETLFRFPFGIETLQNPHNAGVTVSVPLRVRRADEYSGRESPGKGPSATRVVDAAGGVLRHSSLMHSSGSVSRPIDRKVAFVARYVPHFPRFGALLSAFLVLGLATSLAPPLVQAQISLTKIEIDPRRADMMFQKSTQQGEPVQQVIENTLRVRSDGEAPVSLVLFAFRLEDGRVVAKHRSEPFRVSSARPFYPDERFLPGEEFYGLPRVLAHVGPEDIVLASRGVPPSEGTTQIGRILESTVFTERPKDWQERQAIYLIAVPADMRRQRKGVSAHPAVLFAKSAPLGDP